MHLTSERLAYTKITNAEIADYRRWYMNDDVMKYITGKGLTEQEAQARFEKVIETNKKYAEIGFYTVKKKEDNTFIGIAKLVYFNDDRDQAEIGYGSLPEFWGNKYAPEMLGCLIDYAYTMPKIRELIGIVDSRNGASKKVLTDQGFTLYKTVLENNGSVEYYRLVLNR